MSHDSEDSDADTLRPAPATEAGSGAPATSAGFPIVGIGASAGGLDAFTQLLQALPSATGMAFVLVQHLAAKHPSALAEILSRATTMPVAEVIDAMVVEPDHVYIIPPGQSLVIAGGALQLRPREGNGVHLPIDHFFRTLAQDQRHRAIGVVLSGTATDGTLGLEAIKAEGGITFAQDGTAQHLGMPDSAVESGSVDFVLPPDAIAREIVRIGHHPGVMTEAENGAAANKSDFAAVVALLLQATGVDFTHYRSNTLLRRISRRMAFAKIRELGDYVVYLRRTPAEVLALYQDILINVTSFFRDPQAYELLASTVFPRLLQNRASTDPVRFWTLGCSTGQEAYSLAIAFTEAAEAAGMPVALQIFATDINTVSIVKARAGVYDKEIAADVSPERLQRFFVEVEGGYRIGKTIRDACVFSHHDALSDPPFSRIDLISCRNLLIYLESVLQQRILPMLHHALRPTGFLWLGTSEAIGSCRNLFEAADGKQKIYHKQPGSEGRQGHLPLPHSGLPRSSSVAVAPPPRGATDLPREADRVLMSRFAPPGVVVSADLDILQYRGDTSPYLAPAAGTASLGLMKMLREGLLFGVRTAIQRAAKVKVPVREAGLRVRAGTGYHDTDVEVIPLRGPGERLDGGFLVLFEPTRTAIGSVPPPAATAPTATELDNRRLEQELAATRDYLQSVIEQQEAANEELQAANEELQSTNEELETSKEEVHSSNEELATVNDELNTRNTELHRINDDLKNLFDSAQMVVIILDLDLRVRRFTPLAERQLQLLPSDLGRPLVDLALRFTGLPDLQPSLAHVRDSGSTEEHDCRDPRGHWYSMRLRPYRTRDGRIDGVIVKLVDIDLAKRAHAYTESIVATVHEPLLVLDGLLRVRSASRAFYETFGSTPETTVGQVLYELVGGQWDIAELRRLLEAVLERDEHFNDFEVPNASPALNGCTMLLNARRLVQVDGGAPSILLAIEDITSRKQRENVLQVSEIRFRRLFETSQDGILILDAESQKITQVNPFLTNLLDHPAEWFLGKELWEIGFLRDKEASRSALQLIGVQGSIRYESLPLAGSDGQLHPVELVGNLYTEGSHRVIQCNIRDTSERSRLEALLRGQAMELTDLHRRKDEFLAMLSHELRSPLAPIANAVQLLALEHAHESATQCSARGVIERQMNHLQRLVEDLLEVSRITTGRLQLRRELTNARIIVEGAVETVRPLLDQRRHELTLTLPAEPLMLHGDIARLEQVLTNLLTNAIKFTDTGGHIWLSVQLENDLCAIRVRDSGIGISPALLPRIFDLFTQGERTLDRSQGGLGLGLALVEQLTKRHGGTVEAHSVLGQGSEFIVRLPVVRAEVPAPSVAATPRPTTRPLRILVVDDDEDMVISFTMLLKALGHEVRSAADGASAIRTALDYKPDVVLLDIGLPDPNGYEVATQLRQSPSLPGITLVALTGYGQDSDRQRALRAGFDHHLVKPADFARLERILLGAAANLS